MCCFYRIFIVSFCYLCHNKHPACSIHVSSKIAAVASCWLRSFSLITSYLRTYASCLFHCLIYDLSLVPLPNMAIFYTSCFIFDSLKSFVCKMCSLNSFMSQYPHDRLLLVRCAFLNCVLMFAIIVFYSADHKNTTLIKESICKYVYLCLLCHQKQRENYVHEPGRKPKENNFRDN